MDLLDIVLCEVRQEGVRHVRGQCGRNPLCADELSASRAHQKASVERLREDLDCYRTEYPRAQTSTAERNVRTEIARS
jgi:hypothetical protein